MAVVKGRPLLIYDDGALVGKPPEGYDVLIYARGAAHPLVLSNGLVFVEEGSVVEYYLGKDGAGGPQASGLTMIEVRRGRSYPSYVERP